MMWWQFLLVFAGGGLGSVLRYAIGTWLLPARAGEMAWGTLGVNVVGCMLIGVLMPLFLAGTAWKQEYRLFLVVGMLGGFTTFSTFGWESWQLIQAGRWGWAGLNIVLSNGLGLLAVYLGSRWSA